MPSTLPRARSLSKTIDAEVQGEMATLKETVNSMVTRLRVFSSEVTRVAREVGTDGQLGGQAVVHGVEGTWKELVSPVAPARLRLGAALAHLETAEPTGPSR